MNLCFGHGELFSFVKYHIVFYFVFMFLVVVCVQDVTKWCNTVEDTRALRAALKELKLVAFVGDGAILPRAAGIHIYAPAPLPSSLAFVPDTVSNPVFGCLN